MLFTMKRIPQFRCHPKFFTGAKTVFNGSLNALPNIGFIRVVRRTVQVPVAYFDRVIYRLGNICRIDFP